MGPVRDFVRDAWRIAAAFAAGAFVLSLVIGLIASNPFGVAVSRAFLLALLFAGLGAALRGVVKAFLPEILGTANAAAGPAADGKAGGVDIVLPEDETLQSQAIERPAARPRRGRGDQDQTLAPQDTEGIEEPSEVLDAPDDDEMAAAEAQALGALATELGQEPGPAAESLRAGEEGAAGASSPASFVQGEAQSPEERDLPLGADQPGELDALPELGELEPEPPVAQRGSPVPRAPRRGAGESPEDAVRNLLSNEDPATLARAIRTHLKRDEKG